MSEDPYIQTLVRAWNNVVGDNQLLWASYNALKTITTDHERIHAGKMFLYSDVTTIAAGATHYHLLSVQSYDMHLRDVSYEINVGPAELYLYRDPFIDVSSLGAGFRFTNMNDNYAAYTGVASYYYNPYINPASMGTELSAAGVVQATGGSVKVVSGLAASSIVEQVLAAGHDYLLVFTNNDASTGNIERSMTYYEPN